MRCTDKEHIFISCGQILHYHLLLASFVPKGGKPPQRKYVFPLFIKSEAIGCIYLRLMLMLLAGRNVDLHILLTSDVDVNMEGGLWTMFIQLTNLAFKHLTPTHI